MSLSLVHIIMKPTQDIRTDSESIGQEHLSTRIRQQIARDDPTCLAEAMQVVCD